MITIADVVNAVNYTEARKEIVEFIASYFHRWKIPRAVIGLSGGVDSSVALALAAEALGPNRVLALILPSKVTPKEDVEDAVGVAKQVGVKYRITDITPILDSYKVAIVDYDENHLIARGNLMARIRMSILYYYANKLNAMVIGTGDKSELLLGYFTKYGDGGVDILPIGDLYKTQVRAMAKELGLPEGIAKKPSSPRLWAGQTAEGELGMSYKDIDLVLYARELGLPASEIPKQTGVPPAVVRRILKRVREYEHKRNPPPVARLLKSRLFTVKSDR